jgi:hypothetical protein
MLFQMADDFTYIIIGLAVLLIFVVIALILTRKFSKKALRRYFREKGEKSIESDKAFNSLLAVKAITKNYESQGMDVSKVRILIGDADRAMRLDNYGSALDYSERAKKELMELKAKKDEEEKRALEDTEKVGPEELSPTEKEDYQPTTKEVLQKKYPPNYLQAQFTMKMTEDMMARTKVGEKELSEASDLMEKSRACFQSEDFDGALSYSLRCKTILEGPKEDQKTSTMDVVADTGAACSRCRNVGKEGDMFCRRCGNALQ